MGILKNNMKKSNKSQKYLDNTDAHFLNRNYGRTGRADAQTDQQHSTSRFLTCWLKVARAARWCAMPRSWFEFRIFIRVSDLIFLEFFSSFKSFEHQTVRLWRVHCTRTATVENWRH